MSSPMLNNLIIFGGMLTYTYVILEGLDTRFISLETLPKLCNVSIAARTTLKTGPYHKWGGG